MSTYSEKLKNPLWQKRRLSVFERDQWACKSCGAKHRELQVHHLDYIPEIEPWLYPDDMLVTLCNVCHGKENKRDGLEKHLANTFKMQGFLSSDLLCLSCLLETSTTFRNTLLNILRKNQSDAQ